MRRASSRMSLANKGQEVLPYVDDAYPEHGGGSAWIETRFSDCQSQLSSIVCTPVRAQSPLRWNHFAACSHEQWVADLLSESRERVADGRLDRTPVARRASHCAPPSWRRTREEVQIEVRYIHTVHSDYDENATSIMPGPAACCFHGHCKP